MNKNFVFLSWHNFFGSWLNAALNYANILPEEKPVVESFEGSGVLVLKQKVGLPYFPVFWALFRPVRQKSKTDSK